MVSDALIMGIATIGLNLGILYPKNKIVGGIVFLVTGASFLLIDMGDPNLKVFGMIATMTSIISLVYNLVPQRKGEND